MEIQEPGRAARYSQSRRSQIGLPNAQVVVLNIDKPFRVGRRLLLAGSAAALLAAAVHITPGTAAPAPSAAAREQALEDEKQIRDLLEEYGHRFDTLDLVGYSQLFSAQGTWNGNYGGSYVRATGPAEVLAMMTRVLGNPQYDPKKVAGFHVMSNFLIHVEGDHATARSRWTFFTRGEGNVLAPALAGHYEDRLIREKSQWKFFERRVFKDIPTDE